MAGSRCAGTGCPRPAGRARVPACCRHRPPPVAVCAPAGARRGRPKPAAVSRSVPAARCCPAATPPCRAAPAPSAAGPAVAVNAPRCRRRAAPGPTRTAGCSWPHPAAAG
ncbi:hypothetical protein G6F23_012817 [Rhizopus arrhizus]|nr:hypothetical protein G6F23_012817 [Rhizopus arrhizus]